MKRKEDVKTIYFLHDYLQKIGLKKYKFAELTGISVRTISAVCNGFKVRTSLAKTIEVFTNGNVRAKDICINPEKL